MVFILGSGKSAFVANWAKRVDDSEPETFMFVHFIGSSADSANYIKLLRRYAFNSDIFHGLTGRSYIVSRSSYLSLTIERWKKCGSLA